MSVDSTNLTSVLSTLNFPFGARVGSEMLAVKTMAAARPWSRQRGVQRLSTVSKPSASKHLGLHFYRAATGG